MALIPQLQPSAADLARETASAAKIVELRPHEWLGRPRGSKSEDGFYADASYWDAYPDTAPKIVVGDQAAINAYNRIALLVQAALVQAAPPNPDFDPDGITWPIARPPKNWTAGGSFGARRPWGGTQTRWHTGTDLGAPLGTPVLAPENGVIVAANSGWDFNVKTGKGVKAILIASDSGRTWLIGGIRPGSAIVKAGERVKAGQKIAEVGAYEGGDTMAHVSTFDEVLTEAEVNKRKSWPKDGPRPANLIDSGPLLEIARKNTQAGFFPFPDVDDANPSGELLEGLENIVDKINPPSSPLPWILAGLGVAGLVAVVVVVTNRPAVARRRAA
jgi:hypothetical protein